MEPSRREPHYEGEHHGHPHHEEGAQEARQVPNLKLSLRMTKSHPDRTQGWKEGQTKLARHGHGDHPVGGGHHHVRDQGVGGDHQEGATGVTGSPPQHPKKSPQNDYR